MPRPRVLKSLSIMTELSAIEVKRQELVNPLVLELQNALRILEGQTFGSPEECQKFAKAIERLTTRLGCKIRCTKCGEPAYFTFRRQKPGKGHFRFVHYTSGPKRAFHYGRIAIPKLILIADVDEEENGTKITEARA
jgi:hypothetical protein